MTCGDQKFWISGKVLAIVLGKTPVLALTQGPLRVGAVAVVMLLRALKRYQVPFGLRMTVASWMLLQKPVHGNGVTWLPSCAAVRRKTSEAMSVCKMLGMMDVGLLELHFESCDRDSNEHTHLIIRF